MGYWNATADGGSLQLEDTGLIWGDQPADMIDHGVHKLIDRLTGELGRKPTVEELILARDDAPEMTEAIVEAAKVFTEDVGRPPTEEEMKSGLLFSDSAVALDCHR